MKTNRQSERAPCPPELPPGAKMFHDLIWDLGICSIESIESCNLFIVHSTPVRFVYLAIAVKTKLKSLVKGFTKKKLKII